MVEHENFSVRFFSGNGSVESSYFTANDEVAGSSPVLPPNQDCDGSQVFKARGRGPLIRGLESHPSPQVKLKVAKETVTSNLWRMTSRLHFFSFSFLKIKMPWLRRGQLLHTMMKPLTQPTITSKYGSLQYKHKQSWTRLFTKAFSIQLKSNKEARLVWQS